MLTFVQRIKGIARCLLQVRPTCTTPCRWRKVEMTMNIAPRAPMTAAANDPISLPDIIRLINDVRGTANAKISGIQKITGLLRMLALNAMIESARARTAWPWLFGGCRGGARNRRECRPHRR